jgi:TRAP-type transport system periplasmic protein
MKKYVFYSLLLVLMTATLFYSCTAPAATTTAPAASSAPAAAPKVFELRVSHAAPGVAPIAKMVQAMGDRIVQNSNGRVKISYYWTNTLVPYAESFKGIQTGVADIGNHSIAVDFQPLTNAAIMLPFMGYKSMESGTKIFWQLFNSTPAIQKEWSGVKVLVARMMPTMQIHMAKKEVKVPSDVAGIKIGSKGEVATFINNAGGTAIDVQVPDLVMSLNTGLIQGWWSHFPSLTTFKVMEMLKYHTIVGEGGVSMNMDTLIMNQDTWNKMPANLQKVCEEAAQWYTTEMIKADLKEVDGAVAQAKSLNHTVTYLTPDEIKAWTTAALPVHQDYISKLAARGIDAKSVYEAARKLIEADK